MSFMVRLAVLAASTPTLLGGSPDALADARLADDPAVVGRVDGYHVTDDQLRRLLGLLLTENPELAAARRRPEMLRARAESSRALPDPLLVYRYFVDGAETRVGPQEYSIELVQEVPWNGTRRLAEERVERLADSQAFDAEALERIAVARLKRAYFDAAYLQKAIDVNAEEIALLGRLESSALSRYETGEGIQQSVIKIQTEISRLGERRAQLDQRLAMLERDVARLTGRSREPLSLAPIVLPSPPKIAPHSALESMGLDAHPSLDALKQRISADRAWAEHRELDGKPSFRFGIGYTEVGRREDLAGRTDPPEGNGEDILGLTVGLRIPIERSRTDAGVAEAKKSELVHVELLDASRDAITNRAQRALIKIDSLGERARLYDGVIIPQAIAALTSAESAYENDRLGFLDLLDAERVLFESRLALRRLVSDAWIAVADLEEAAGRISTPLPDAPDHGGAP